ncbi:acid sphingomyelinase-like phosphodiesterase 3b [Grus japonensis]|uniref:Acid sphingomyelinase-like phosphodiesterase 3b n=1 Tax=Grus japonensis TaxID=30415 RepID=A0ABC9YGU9_GRUJA
MPAGSKTDPLLAKAEPISSDGSTSVITYLRREKKKKKISVLQPERGVRRCERNNCADTKVSEEGGGGGTPGARADIPLQPMVKTMVRQAVPLQPMEVNGGADIHLQPVEDPPHQSR